jgi:MFS family permease
VITAFVARREAICQLGTGVRGLRQTIGDALRSLRDVFRNRALRRIQLAFAASIVGDWAYAVAVAVYAYDHGGATAVGVLGVVRYVSLAIVTPFGAVLGDRYRRRLVMVGCDLTRAVLVFAAAALIAGGGAELAVYALSILAAIAGSPFRSAQAALLPDLAEGPAELSAANVASSTIESVGFFAGPALAGILLAVTTIPVVYVLNGATFLVSAVLVLGVHEARRTPRTAAEQETDTATTGEGFFREASAGYREILGSRDLRLLIGLYCAQTVVAGASLVFNVAIALELLDIGRSGLGFLDSVLGIGGLVGGFLALVLAQRGRLARDFGVGVLLWSAPLLLVAIWPTLAAAAVVMIVLGLANSVVDVNAYTIVQRIAPEQAMARVFGAMESALIGGMALGALLMPLLIATIGLRWGLAAIGIAVSACVLAGAAALRRVDTTALAPPGLELLRGVSLLSLLPGPTLERLARKLIRVEAAEGEIVIRQGDAGDRFYVIESGELEVSKDGRFVATLGPGDFAGEIALLRDVPRTATVKATCPTVLQALERTVFIPAVTGQGAFGEAADAAIATRLSML